jgi:hypothetical protein
VLSRSLRNLRLFRGACLVADLTGIFKSSRNAKFGKDIDLEYEPDKENDQHDKYIGHCFSLQPTAEMIYAQEKPREDVLQEGAAAPLWLVAGPEEKTDRRRSVLDPSHLGHLIEFWSVENTICSNSVPHLLQRNSNSGMCSSLRRFRRFGVENLKRVQIEH